MENMNTPVGFILLIWFIGAVLGFVVAGPLGAILGLFVAFVALKGLGK